MRSFGDILRTNANYRYTWMGQVVSEVGDHFNTIAVLSLALHMTGSGVVVGGVMLSRTLPAILAGPLAGVALDFTPIDPIKALFWSAVINGVIAVPIMIVMMLMADDPAVMGPFTVTRRLKVLGWLATWTMAAAVVAMVAGS